MAKKVSDCRALIPHKPTGRPSIYSEYIVEEICRRLAEGESMRSICKDDHMPTRDTVHRWAVKKNLHGFSDRLMRARQMQAATLFDECLDIADDDSNDIRMRRTTTRDGTVIEEELPNTAAIQRANMRIQTRQTMAAVMAPHKFSERYLSVQEEAKSRVDRIEVVFLPARNLPEPKIINERAISDE